MDKRETLYGGVETGGTSCACVIGTRPDEVVAETRFPTTTPQDTITQIVGFFKKHARAHPVSAVGVGAFGPLDLDTTSPTYGHVTRTPKPGWTDVDVCGSIERALRVPVIFDTDVNAAAFGEYHWGVGRNAAYSAGRADPLVYVTVGTGIGVGAVIDGRPLHGSLHPEAGHMLLPHDRTLDPFAGSCPFHGDCWEGLASGAALKERYGQAPETLPHDHPAWKLEARYLGLGLANLIYCISPRVIVVGGGVMQHPGLLEDVRRVAAETIGGYLDKGETTLSVERLILRPGLDSQAGVLGALALAALRSAQPRLPS